VTFYRGDPDPYYSVTEPNSRQRQYFGRARSF
jgi:hypothetical protein